MKQMSLASTVFELVTKRTHKQEFLDAMNLDISWSELLSLIASHELAGKPGRLPFAAEVVLCIHLREQFFGYCDPAMEESLHDIPLYQEFAHQAAGMSTCLTRAPSCGFAICCEALGAGATDSRHRQRKTDRARPRDAPNREGQPVHVDMMAHICPGARSGLGHTVTITAANSHDTTQAYVMLHEDKEVVFAYSSYRGVEKREEAQEQHSHVDWQIAMTPCKRKASDKGKRSHVLQHKLEKVNVKIQVKVEHSFGVIKYQFVRRKRRYSGLTKNPRQFLVMFALSNLWRCANGSFRGCRHECACNARSRAQKQVQRAETRRNRR